MPTYPSLEYLSFFCLTNLVLDSKIVEDFETTSFYQSQSEHATRRYRSARVSRSYFQCGYRHRYYLVTIFNPHLSNTFRLMFAILAVNIVGGKLGYCDNLPDNMTKYGIGRTEVLDITIYHLIYRQ